MITMGTVLAAKRHKIKQVITKVIREVLHDPLLCYASDEEILTVFQGVDLTLVLEIVAQGTISYREYTTENPTMYSCEIKVQYTTIFELYIGQGPSASEARKLAAKKAVSHQVRRNTAIDYDVLALPSTSSNENSLSIV